MLKKALSISLMAVLLVFTAQNSFAQNKQNNGSSTTETTKESEFSRQAQLAMDLVNYGYENKYALSLVQAAQFFSVHPAVLRTFDLKEDNSKTGNPVHSYDPSSLLKDAKFFAGKDAELLAYIDKVEKEIANKKETKGEVQGVDYASVYLSKGQTKTITLDASSFSWNEVSARTNNSAKLKIYVYTDLEDKGWDSGTRPRLSFHLGICSTVYVEITNLDSYSTTTEIVLTSTSF